MPRTENLLADALRRSIRYLEGARTRRVSPAQADVERLAELGGSLPEHPVDAQRTLGLIDELGSPATVINAGGRYFGIVLVREPRLLEAAMSTSARRVPSRCEMLKLETPWDDDEDDEEPLRTSGLSRLATVPRSPPP